MNGCAAFVFALGFLAIGIGFVVSGLQLAPRDRAAAQAFRTDRSCTAALSGNPPPGNCTVVVAKTLVTATRTAGFGRTRSRTPYVYVLLADGTSYTDDLEGSDGRYFVASVNSGAPARAQFFRGKLVRVASGSSSAETISAPDVAESAVSQMPWVGGALIAIAGLIVFAAVRGK